MSDSWITREKKNIYIYIYARPPKKIHLWLVVSQHLPTLWGVKNHGTLWCFCFPQLQLHFLKKDSDISGPHLRTMICCEQFSFLVVMAACIKPQVLEGSKDHKWLIYSWKLTWLSGKSPFSIGNTSTHSWRIFQPVMLVNSGVYTGPFHRLRGRSNFRRRMLAKTNNWKIAYFNKETSTMILK